MPLQRHAAACCEEGPSVARSTAMVARSSLIFSAAASICDAVAQSTKAQCKDGHRVVQHLRAALNPTCQKSKRLIKSVRMLFLVADGFRHLDEHSVTKLVSDTQEALSSASDNSADASTISLVA